MSFMTESALCWILQEIRSFHLVCLYWLTAADKKIDKTSHSSQLRDCHLSFGVVVCVTASELLQNHLLPRFG